MRVVVTHTGQLEPPVLRAPLGTPLDPRGSLTCDWREGDVW